MSNLNTVEIKRRGLILASEKPSDLARRVAESNASVLRGEYRDSLALWRELSFGALYQEREWLETDTSKVQLIPYMVSRVGGKFACYARREGVGEVRLVGKLSVGFGGHCDLNEEAVGWLNKSGWKLDTETLSQCVNDTAHREMDEECVLSNEGRFTLLNTGLYIYNDSDEVNSVHLGVLFELCSPGSVLGVKEESLVFLGYLSPEEIASRGAVEEWSKAAMGLLSQLGERQ